MQHPEIDASEIEVQVEDSEVTLTGSVNNRRAKHLAEDLVDSISGVSDVNNQLRVSKNDLSSTSSQQNAQTSNQSTGSRESPGDHRSAEAATTKGGTPQSSRGKASSS